MLTSILALLSVCLIALGVRDLYVNPSAKTKAWDTCAPEAILGRAGGRLTALGVYAVLERIAGSRVGWPLTLMVSAAMAVVPTLAVASRHGVDAVLAHLPGAAVVALLLAAAVLFCLDWLESR